jgi:diaminobutyrate-2-oxoglutarate transaminase
MARARLERMASACGGKVRGRGLILGLECPDATLPGKISRLAFEQGLIVETAGAEDQVLKLLPPLTIELAELADGLDRLEHALDQALQTTPVVAEGRRAAS